MLQCRRCSSALTAEDLQDLLPHHCDTAHYPPPKHPPPPLVSRPHYQNVAPPIPPRVPPPHPTDPLPAPVAPSPSLRLMQHDAALQVEVAALRLALAEKQLEQSRLQQTFLSRVQGDFSSLNTPLPAPGFLSAGPWLYSPPSPPQEELDSTLAKNRAELDQCSWYYGALTWQESAHLLQDAEQGTFLVRDSCSKDPSCRFSLSVQRRREDVWSESGRLLRAEGPTSVRIQFVNGEFRLDADGKIQDRMPRFPSVARLVGHYVQLSRRKGRREVLIEQEEQEARGAVSGLLLKGPLLKEAPKLGHLARLAINKSIGGQEAGGKERQGLHLPAKLLAYLDSYPLGI